MVLTISRSQRDYADAVNKLVSVFRNKMRVMVLGHAHFVKAMRSEKDVVIAELWKEDR